MVHSILAFMVCTPIILIMTYVSITFSNTSLYKTRIQQVVCAQVNLIWKEIQGKLPLHEKSPYSEFFWSVFSRIRTKYGEIQSMSPYLVRLRENTNQKNSEYGRFPCSVLYAKKISLFEFFSSSPTKRMEVKSNANQIDVIS